ncbi:MAG TPA: cofactor assembly of complex C subunit B [Trichocoleus sp.]
MTNAILSSTFLLTLLLMVGLFFFIRAATKDRTETLQATITQPPEALQEVLQAYFEQRAYRPVAVDAAAGRTTFSGFVRPSVFLATFLSLMAAIGGGCLALVLAILFPNYTYGFPVLLLAAPAAGAFYWRRAGREEQIIMTVAPAEADNTAKVTIAAHRDELIALKQVLSL